MTLSQPVGTWTQRKRYTNRRGDKIDELMEYELTRETVLESESQLNERVGQFRDQFGVDFQAT